MKKFFEFLLIVFVPWAIIFWIVFTFNSDKDRDFYAKEKIEIKHDKAPVDHSKFAVLQKKFTSGPEVTKACLSCHNGVGEEFMKTEHWKWHKKDSIPGRGVKDLGKKNTLNNFCIGVNSNEKLCSMCHAGYGYGDKSFDFTNQDNIDCLICHDQTKTYRKSNPCMGPNLPGSGVPDIHVDLSFVAQNVGAPQRNNCGSCHFTGGGGNNVKHGDLEMGLLSAHTSLNGEVDVHMGMGDDGQNMTCVDCHKTSHHQISGQLYSLGSSNTNKVTCEQCHTANPHKSKLLNEHNRTVACQTCHITDVAKLNHTKIIWDWSTAARMDKDGKPIIDKEMPGDTYTYEGKVYEDVEIQYDSRHGTAVFQKNVKPEYVWFNGNSDHYITGDKIKDTTKVLTLNPLFGSYADNVHPADLKHPSKIYPVKVMRGKQPYDPVNRILIQPKLAGKIKGSNALWADYDWNASCKAGMEYIGQPYSGKYAFLKTQSMWPLNHEVSQKEQALQCIDCHNPNSSRLKDLTSFYLPGRDRNPWVDNTGVIFIILVVLGVTIHGFLRIVSSKKSN
jgi:octaheme c-type cytochrome (tetrathionate reductase family)